MSASNADSGPFAFLRQLVADGMSTPKRRLRCRLNGDELQLLCSRRCLEVDYSPV
jgi:hypothetical protein